MDLQNHFKQFGAQAAKESLANINTFKISLEQIMSGFQNDPDRKFTLSPEDKEFQRNRIDNLKNKAEKLKEKGKEFEKLEDEQRQKKNKLRDEKLELEKNSEFNWVKFYSLVVLTVVLSVLVFGVYGIFWMHITSGIELTSIFPTNEQFLQEFRTAGGAMLMGLLPLMLVYITEFTHDKEVLGIRRIISYFLIAITFGLDIFIAYNIHIKTNETNAILGLTQTIWYNDINFWMTLIAGIGSAFTLLYSIYIMRLNSSREIKKRKFQIGILNNQISNAEAKERKFREKSNANYQVAEEVELEIMEIERMINKTFIPESSLKERMNNFFIGWINELRKMNYDKDDREFNRIVEPFNQDFETTIKRIESFFNYNLNVSNIHLN